MKPGARSRPLAAGAICALIVAGIGGTITDTGPWYAALSKPVWQPPGWIFAPVWTVIFAACTWAFAEAWVAATTRPARAAILWLFGTNMVLNVGWSALFFALRRPDWALIEVVLLWLSIAVLIRRVLPISLRAAALLAPYLLWVTIAAVLNLEVVRLNGPFGP